MPEGWAFHTCRKVFDDSTSTFVLEAQGTVLDLTAGLMAGSTPIARRRAGHDEGPTRPNSVVLLADVTKHRPGVEDEPN